MSVGVVAVRRAAAVQLLDAGSALLEFREEGEGTAQEDGAHFRGTKEEEGISCFSLGGLKSGGKERKGRRERTSRGPPV